MPTISASAITLVFRLTRSASTTIRSSRRPTSRAGETRRKIASNGSRRNAAVAPAASTRAIVKSRRETTAPSALHAATGRGQEPRAPERLPPGGGGHPAHEDDGGGPGRPPL